MKIIIAYASAGGGHLKAAQAIYNYFKEKDPGLDIKLIDALDYTSSSLRNAYTKGYDLCANHATWVWGIGFYLTNLRLLRPLINWLHSTVNRINCQKLIDFFICENPDLLCLLAFGYFSAMAKKASVYN